LQIRAWNDKDGNKRRTAEVVADNVYFGDSKRGADNSSAVPNYGGYDTPPQDYAEITDDDAQLPF
jgi:single-strand DNA-binding protein